MRKFTKKNVILFLVLIIALFCLIFTFRDLDFHKFLTLLKKTRLEFILAWVLIFILGTLLRVYRWLKILGHSMSEFKLLYHALNLGNLASMILPFRAGEFVRPYYLTQWTSVSLPRSMTSVVIERIFDLIGMFVVFFYFTSTQTNIPDFIRITANSLGILCLVLTVSVFLTAFFPKFIESFSRKIFSFLPNSFEEILNKILEEVIYGLSELKNISSLLIIMLSTAFIWLSYCLGYSLVLNSLGEFDGSLTVGAVVCVFVAIAIAAPNAPGFLLTFELGVSSALALFSYSEEFSLACAILAHSLQFLSIVLLGLFSLWFKGLKISNLKAGLG